MRNVCPWQKRVDGHRLKPSGSLQKHQLTATVSEEFLAKIDSWRREQPDLPTRTEALRRLIEKALAAPKEKGRK